MHTVTAPPTRTTRTRSLTASVAVALAALGGSVSGGDRPGGGIDAREVTYRYVNAAQIELVDAAIERFEQAGLDLPPIDVIGSRTDPVCREATAAHRRLAGRSQVIVCGPGAGPVEELVFLHELAHAWDHHALSDDRREAFLELRGLERWRGDDVRWNDRGAEQAADVVAWALVGRDVTLSRLHANGCDELAAGYRVLTGTDPPRRCPVT